MGRKSREKRAKKQEGQSYQPLQETNPEGSSLNANKAILHFLLLAGLILGVYAISINNEFVWDDTLIIKENPDIKSLNNAFKLLVSEDTLPNVRTHYYRPVTYLSYMTDYALWQFNPRGYHAFNILLHLVFTCLLYLFVYDILKNSRAALAAALLFGLHPAATETVNFISGGRNTLLCGVFLLSALLLHRKGWIGPTLVFFTLSVFSKEFGLLFPFIAALTDRMFPRVVNEKMKGMRSYILYAPVMVFYILVRAYVVGSGFDLKLETLPGRILMIPKIIDTYLKVLVFPYKLTTPYYFQLPSGITKEVIAYTLILIIIAVSLYAFRKFSTVTFSSLWFIIFVLPVLNVIPLGDIVAAERYIYIAMAGYVILLGTLSVRLTKSFFVPLVILVCALYSIIVINRNPIWKNNLTLFSDAILKSPDYHLPHNNLGNAFWSQGRFDEATNEYQIAIKIRSDYAEAHNNLGVVYSAQSRLNEAINEYQSAIKIKPDYADAHFNLGNAYSVQGRFDEAISEFQSAIKIKPDYADAHNNLGNACSVQGRFDEAISEFQSAIKIKPDYADAHYNLGNAYSAQGRFDEAINEYQIVIKIKPDYADAHCNLGNAYLAKGLIDEAINEYQTAIKIKPDFVNARNNLNFVLQKNKF